MNGVRGAVLALAASAALLSVTGCGSAAGGSVADHPGGRSAETSADVRSGGDSGKEAKAQPEGGGARKASGRSDASDAPKVPKAELTPATGSFTEKQKRYLEGRVPDGIDPAAILAGGAEICERISRTEEVDRKAVIEAIKSKEIAGAKAAVTHLCPKHKDLLTAAGN